MPYPAIILRPKAEKAVYNRHPWIFSGAIQQAPQATEGEIVKVLSSENKLLGYGFYAPQSQIRCRMFHWRTEVTEDLNGFDYWHNRIQDAFRLRQQLVINPETNIYRLIHAEGDLFPGLIIDIYNNIAVGQILVKGTEKLTPHISNSLQQLGLEGFYLKAKTSSQQIEDVKTPSGWQFGNSNGPIECIENGLKFLVDVESGQKTGFFIDQRDNRQLLKSLSKNKKVLNTFSYTGGFSVYALAGGAEEVVSTDISEEALRIADQNVALNFAKAPHKSIAADCFNFLKEMPENYYDIIVLDPPAFAKTARAVPNATRGYKQINLQAFRRIKPNGLVFTFSCSQNISKELFKKIVFGAAADAGRHVRIIHQLHQPADHPINIYHPEGEYLKGLVLFVS